MCKAPKPPEIKEPKKPQFLRNRYLDEFVGGAQAIQSLKTGRNSLRIPAGSETSSSTGQQPGQALPQPINVNDQQTNGTPRGNPLSLGGRVR